MHLFHSHHHWAFEQEPNFGNGNHTDGGKKEKLGAVSSSGNREEK